MRGWTEAEVSENSENEGEQRDDCGEWEAEGAELEWEEVSEEERENESERRPEERGGGEEAERWEETRRRRRREESDVEKEREEEMDGSCEKEVNQEDGGVDEGEVDEVKWYEREVNESKREDSENDRTTQELEEIEGGYEEEGATSEIGGSEELRDSEKDVEEDGEKLEERKFEGEKMKEKDTRSGAGDEDHLVGMERDQMLENQKSVNALDEEIRREVIERREESDDVDDIEEPEEPGEMEAKDGEEMKEEPEEKCDYSDDDDDEMEEAHQKQCGQHVSGTGNQQSEDMKTQNNPTFNAENNLQGPTESENEDFNLSDFEDENFKCAELKKKEVEMHESNMVEASTMETTFQKESSCYERDEEEVQSDKMAVETRRLQDDDSGLQEEEEEDEEVSTDDEDDCSAEEGEDSGDEDVVKVYCKEDFVNDFFGTLSEFRHSSVLTDLILTTVDGKSLHVHTAVMAAVSSHIRASLSPSEGETITVRDCNEGGIRRRLVSLGPEVDRVGLEAVVEFAYTGFIPCPHVDTIHRIKTAAESLGAIRVLDVCTEVEERSKNTQGQKKDVVSAEEEMVKTLQAIKQLWADGAGCDVTLEVLGGSFHGQ